MLSELTNQGIQILDIFYCPHGRDEGCSCMKPQSGMIKEAVQKYPEININESFMVGDSIADVNLAVNINMRGFGIGIDTSHPNLTKLKNVSDLINYI